MLDNEIDNLSDKKGSATLKKKSTSKDNS